MADSQDIKRNDSPKTFFNPLHKKLELEYRDDNNEIENITLAPLSALTYPTFKADFLIKHIIDALIDERELGYVTPGGRKLLQQEVEE